MPKKPEMGFFDHFEELRLRVVAVFLVFVLATLGAFSLMDRIMPLLSLPAADFGVRLYALSPFEKFIAYLKASALLGAAFTLPVAAALVASFVAPALGPRARRALIPALVLVCGFVLAGAALAWLVMVPFAIRFFAHFAAGDGIEPLWSLGSYVSLVAGLVSATALLCLVPPALLGLIRAGLLRVEALARRRREIIVAIAIVAAVLTPTVDVVSQCAVGVVLWAMFELTLLLGRLIAPARAAREGGTIMEGRDG
jgi:sec-independent protein translocase protein TatC